MISSANPTQCPPSASPEFSGKVAVIDRGSCPFADKICNAQLQGATAAIVVNNVDGGVFTMGGYSGYEILPKNKVTGLARLSSLPRTNKVNTPKKRESTTKYSP